MPAPIAESDPVNLMKEDKTMIDDYRDKPAKCGPYKDAQDRMWVPRAAIRKAVRTHEESVEPDKRWLGATLCGLSAVVTIGIVWGAFEWLR